METENDRRKRERETKERTDRSTQLIHPSSLHSPLFHFVPPVFVSWHIRSAQVVIRIPSHRPEPLVLSRILVGVPCIGESVKEFWFVDDPRLLPLDSLHSDLLCHAQPLGQDLQVVLFRVMEALREVVSPVWFVFQLEEFLDHLLLLGPFIDELHVFGPPPLLGERCLDLFVLQRLPFVEEGDLHTDSRRHLHIHESLDDRSSVSVHRVGIVRGDQFLHLGVMGIHLVIVHELLELPFHQPLPWMHFRPLMFSITQKSFKRLCPQFLCLLLIKVRCLPPTNNFDILGI
mmetsp:Transcript_19302/g.38917  ORF Transcript_19302/g.38917 Transcript_19302/m.38917 type:complete len:288 (-) Transcript_19302:1408-2271(-)